MIRLVKHFLLLLTTIVPLSAKGPVFLEKGGIIAIEAESTFSRKGGWKEKTDVKGFSGTCHLEFTGNSITNGPPKSPLKYQFKVKKAGKYQLTIRARKRLESKRHDLSNDCYVSLKGDFEAGGGAPLKILKKETKMFGGEADKWGWTTQLDFDHKKAAAIYDLKEGKTYELTISGRSKNFNFDRFILVHESQDLRKVRSSNPRESKSTDARPEPKEIVVRMLTDTQGRQVEAELVRLVGDTIQVKIKRKSFELMLDTLSDEDQEFIRNWAKENEDGE